MTRSVVKSLEVEAVGKGSSIVSAAMVSDEPVPKART